MEVFIFGNSEIEDLSLLAAVKEGGRGGEGELGGSL